MCVREEAKRLLRDLALPGESKKEIHLRLSRKLKWGFSRVRESWYGRSVLRAEEIDQLRALAGNNGDARHETIEARIAQIERRLAIIDPEFFAPHIGGLRQSRNF